MAYGYTDTSLHSYEEDHWGDPANLWPEYGGSPNPKDKIENMCNQKVCDGLITLHDAQLQIAVDWHTACQ